MVQDNMRLESYRDVGQAIASEGRPFHLMIGNGFSMAYDPLIFSYNALYDFVKSLDDDVLSTLFGVVDTRNFELMHNRYLTYCYETLTSIDGSLVTFGFNFGDYDQHIIDAINIAAKHGRRASSKLWSIYIGVYSPDDQKRIESIQVRFKCKVHIFDAKTANVWG